MKRQLEEHLKRRKRPHSHILVGKERHIYITLSQTTLRVESARVASVRSVGVASDYMSGVMGCMTQPIRVRSS